MEPLTIAEKGLLQAWTCRSGLPWGLPAFEHSTADPSGCVLGAGPVGLLGAMALAEHGFEVTVYSRDREPDPSADIVKAIGGKYISSQDQTIEQMAADVGNHRSRL